MNDIIVVSLILTFNIFYIILPFTPYYSPLTVIYVNVFCKTKKQYYSNFEVCNVADKIFFWKTMKCFFSNKSNNFGTITLIKNNMVISDDHEIVDIFLEYFDTAVPKLGLAILKYVIFTANCIERILFLKQCINIKGILEYLDSTKIIKT